jgi:hypothetical protein
LDGGGFRARRRHRCWAGAGVLGGGFRDLCRS